MGTLLKCKQSQLFPVLGNNLTGSEDAQIFYTVTFELVD